MAISAASVIMLLVFAFLRRRKVKTEVLFAVIYLFMSFTTLAAVPAFNSPDEYSHFLRSYEVSRGHMTSEGNGGMICFHMGELLTAALSLIFPPKTMFHSGISEAILISGSIPEKHSSTDLEIQLCMRLHLICHRL